MGLIIAFLVSFSIGSLGCFLGIFYNILECITGREFKWMYPIANILWFTGFLSNIIIIIIMTIKNVVLNNL